MLPAYDKANVALTDEEHTHAADLYDAVRIVQEKASDGFQIDDLFALPEVIQKSQSSINWIVQGESGDPTDDGAIGVRIEAVGHALVRAGQFLQRLNVQVSDGGS